MGIPASRPYPDQLAMRQADEDWRLLLYFSIYRGVLAIMLVLLVLWGIAPRAVANINVSLFSHLAWSYLGFSACALLAASGRWGRINTQVVAQVFVDILVVTLIMHAAGGVVSGFGLLLVITVAGGSILTEGKIAALFAAMATLAVLTQQIYTFFNQPLIIPHYTNAGLLGAVFFTAAFFTSSYARRLRHSEALAARQGVDLANLAALNDHIIQRMQSGAMVVDPGGRIRLANESARRLLGLTGTPPNARLAELKPELDKLYQLWREGDGKNSYFLEPSGHGLRSVVSFAAMGEGGQEGTLVFFEDAALTTQRAQQLKLASLGRMAGSIAHEIRNPLGAISHAGQLLEESRNLDSADRRLTRIIHDNSARMNAMVENILQLGRQRATQPRSFELKPWLEQFINEYDNRHPGTGAAIECTVVPADLQVRMDPSQLHQVLWNLCDNGLQHAAEPARVCLTGGLSASASRPYLEVTDNGSGVDPEAGDQIFEPFFTTRKQGTGLGLYIARELCEGNLASLSLEFTAQGGSFRITFPDPRRKGVMNP